MMAFRLTIFLTACILISGGLSDSSSADVEEIDHMDYSNPIINEAIGYMNNVMEDYRRHVNPRLNIDFTAPQYQGMYKMWKRNADIINTLLGFPRRLFLAGR